MHEQLSDYVVPMIAGLVFIAVMSRVQDTVRLALNAVLVVGASGVYMSGGLGMWELVYATLAGARARVLRAAFLLRDRHRLALSRGLGQRAPPVRQPDLAVYAELVTGLPDLRHCDRRVVSVRSDAAVYTRSHVRARADGEQRGHGVERHAHDARELTLQRLAESGRLTHAPPETPGLQGSDAANAALGYPRANCGHCHNAARPAHAE
jgi:hypothetical protein